MSTADNLSLLEKRAQNRFIVALGFFILCIFLAGGIFLYQRSVKNDIQSIDSQLQTINQSIREMEANPLVQSYILYQRNKPVLERLGYESEIPLFVSHIKTTALRYGVEITGFTYNQGQLSMNVRSDNDQRGFGYEKVVSFLRDYRNDDNALFHLNNVNTFRGHDRIEYAITMSLKSQSELGSADESDDEEILDTPEETSENQAE